MISDSNIRNSTNRDGFDANWYSNEYPDVARSKLNPEEHYLKFGKLLGRMPVPPDFHYANIPHVVAKRPSLSGHDETALLVTHAPAGRLRPHVLPYMKQFADAGVSVVLVVVADRPVEMLEAEIAAASGIIVRENAGYDFGAWAHGFNLLPSLFDAPLLIMTNDSVIPTADPAAFQAMIDRVRTAKADVVGLTANHEYRWHLQSYFLAVKNRGLHSPVFRSFVKNIRMIDNKDDVIRAYEIPFADRMRAGDLTVKALYNGPYPNNPVIWSWRELVEMGFPFIKLLLLRKIMSIFTSDKEMLDELHHTWPTVLRAAGFDVRLVRQAIRAADMSSIERLPSKRLLHNPERFQRI